MNFNLHTVFNVFYCAFVISNAVLGFHCYQLLKFSELKIPGSIFRCICLSNIKLSGMHYLKKNLPGPPSRSHVLLRRRRVQLGEDVDDQGVDHQHPPSQPPCHPAPCQGCQLTVDRQTSHLFK